MMKFLMKKKNVASLGRNAGPAEELGVRIYVCEMSMDLMGFKREEIISYKHLGSPEWPLFCKRRNQQGSAVHLNIPSID
jgi:hypothetical protein